MRMDRIPIFNGIARRGHYPVNDRRDGIDAHRCSCHFVTVEGKPMEARVAWTTQSGRKAT